MYKRQFYLLNGGVVSQANILVGAEVEERTRLAPRPGHNEVLANVRRFVLHWK